MYDGILNLITLQDGTICSDKLFYNQGLL